MEALLLDLRSALAETLILGEADKGLDRLLENLSAVLESSTRRGLLIANVVQAISALLADGYPKRPHEIVHQDAIDEMTRVIDGAAS